MQTRLGMPRLFYFELKGYLVMKSFNFKIILRNGKASLFFIDGQRVSKSKFVFLEIQVSMSSGRFDTLHTTRTRSGNWAHHKTGYLTS